MTSPAVVNYESNSRCVEIRDLSRPAISPTQVLLEVAAVGVCGSDLHQWLASHSWDVNYPVVLGHEFAGTIVETAQACMDSGAATVWAGCTHAVLSGPAIDRIQQSCLTEVVVTNTLPLHGKDQICPKIRCLSVAPLLGEAIKRIHEERSVTSLFV